MIDMCYLTVSIPQIGTQCHCFRADFGAFQVQLITLNKKLYIK